MKRLYTTLFLAGLFTLGCGDDEPPSEAPPMEFEFSLTEENDYALTAAVVYEEPCGFGRDGVTRTLVLTPWALDCSGPKIVSSALRNWKAVTINLDDICFDVGMDTAIQTVEEEGDGITHTSFNHGPSHDVAVIEAKLLAEEDGAETFSFLIDIFPKFQGASGESIGQLSGTVPFCGFKAPSEANGPTRAFWQPATD